MQICPKGHSNDLARINILCKTVNGYLSSNQSDHDTRIWYHRTAACIQRMSISCLPLFLIHQTTRPLADFSFNPLPHLQLGACSQANPFGNLSLLSNFPLNFLAFKPPPLPQPWNFLCWLYSCPDTFWNYTKVAIVR